jgi:hypothetical protein
MITNMELRFEPCVLNLIWEVMHKRPKKNKKQKRKKNKKTKKEKKFKKISNFYKFWSKEVHSKKTSKKNPLMFECYNLLDPMEYGAQIFRNLFPTR